MPINIDQFEQLLQDHPNQPFICSVSHALCEGFWPWADTSNDLYPSINDNSMLTCSKTDEQVHFIHDQLHEEICLGCVSESFGTDLYSGMFSYAMFNSLRAKPLYNTILMSAVNVLLHFMLTFVLPRLCY
jgi:hypothetical protein